MVAMASVPPTEVVGDGGNGLGLPAFLAAYFIFMLVVVVAVLFGEHDRLVSTPFGMLHRFLLGGWYDLVVHASQKIMGKTCGAGLRVSNNKKKTIYEDEEEKKT